eukprot:CAMPEP_0195517700 /NCGR_PEP_ID=MMETSP0794_2-20130614/11361_1 /TAXON_ID=515487 /ORGANISM="Stephanopyxis turris, Strain CCMP 815" /LENGTH=2125 /DNA_ID=CAMNT_0040646559 /DNA_START=136 /DNA_END=6513 /DNA_ORIENTATION=-
MTLLAAAASLSGAQAETLDWNSVCTRAEGTGWFPVIVPGCKEALSADGYGDYDVAGAFRHSDCYSASVDNINSLMENNEMKIEFPSRSKTMYIRLVDEDGEPRDFSTTSHVFQWKWDELADYMGPCGHDSQNENYYWLFSKSSNYAMENCESSNYESGITEDGFFSNDWDSGTSFWADQTGWDTDIVISVNVEDYCKDHVTFTFEAQEMGYCGDEDLNRLCSVDYNGGLLPANESTCLNVDGHWQGGSWVVDSSSGEWSIDDCDIRCTEMICANDIMCAGYTFFKEYGTIRLASVIDNTVPAGGTYCMQKMGGATVLVGDGGGCRLNATYASLDARDFSENPGLVRTDSAGLPNMDACNNLCYTYEWCKSFAFSEDIGKCLMYDWIPESVSTIRSEDTYSCYTYEEYIPEATLPPAATTCQDDIDGGGWSLVRRVKQGRKWHPATDQLAGTSVYGTFVNDGSVGETFSRYYADELDGNTEFLFSSGDCYYWLITNELNAVYRRGAPFLADILTASDIQQHHQALWYHRSTNLEDPWISLEDHFDSVYGATVLYGENDWYGDSRDTLLADHNGANVYIRPGQRTPAPTGDQLVRPAPQGPSRLSIPSPSNNPPIYKTPSPANAEEECCALFLGPNSGANGEYEVRVDFTGTVPGEEDVAPSLRHSAPAGEYTIRAQVFITNDWDGVSSLLHSRMFDVNGAAIVAITSGSTSTRDHWEYIEATIDTGSKVPGSLSVYLGYPMQNDDGYVYISQLTVTDEDGYNWVPNSGEVDCDTGIVEGPAGNNTIDSYGNIGVTTVPCDYDVIPAPEIVSDLCEVEFGPWAGESPSDSYCNWYKVRDDAMCRDKIWLGKDHTLPECWALVEADDRCDSVMYGDGSSSCACVPVDTTCTYAESTIGNAVYSRCCYSKDVEETCWNNCGSYTSDKSCFCTKDCHAVGDCCDDYDAVCASPAPERADDVSLDSPIPGPDAAPSPTQQFLEPRAAPTPSPIIEIDQTTVYNAFDRNPSPAAQTCKGNCQYPWTGASNTATASCFCDRDCDDYNDCCEDKNTWCRNGCTNQACFNYDPAALVDDGGCYGCDQLSIPAPFVPDRMPAPSNPAPSSVNPSPRVRTPTPTPAPGRRQQDWPMNRLPSPDAQSNQFNNPAPDQSCVGNCYAPWHSDGKQACWCDDDCARWEDCCEDKEDACPNTPAQNPAPHPGPHAAHVVPSPTPGPDDDGNNYDDHEPSPTPAPMVDSNGNIIGRPAPSETDPVTSCEGYCDYPYHSSIPNSCWCDVYCIEHGDCCEDRDICVSDCELEITEIYERVLCRTPETSEIVDLLDACTAPGENVAATKADCVVSSSYDSDTTCDAALDGKRGTSSRTCSPSLNVACDDVCAEEDPFMQFDLSVMNGIGIVTVKNVLDTCASRMFAHGGECDWSMSSSTFDNYNEGAIIGLSQNPCVVGKGCSGIECGKLEQPNEFGNYEVDCQGQFGRYVWIYLPGDCRVLSVAEITVEVPDDSLGMWFKEQFDDNGNEGFCEDHETNRLCANGAYEYLNGGFGPVEEDTCDLANEIGVWDFFSCGHECAQDLCAQDGACNGYVHEKSGYVRLVNRVTGVGKEDDSHCYQKSDALGDKGKKTFPLIEYELYNSEEYEDCDWCQAQCDADPMDCSGAWGEWGSCSSSCGEGTTTRYYYITQQAYSGGEECEYKRYEEQTTTCSTGIEVDGEIMCPVDCEGDWDDWTDCTVTCGGGSQTRLFTVTAAAAYGGYDCETVFDTDSDVVDVGDTWTEEATCSNSYCPSDCLGAWSDWTECPVTCGSELNYFTSLRTYEIITPARLGGDDCPEYDGTIESGIGDCSTDACAIDITIWVDDDLTEYWINDALSQWVDSDGYVIGSIDHTVDPAILYNADDEAVAEIYMAQVTENNVDTVGIGTHIDANDDELDAIYAEFGNTMELDESNELLGTHNIIIGGYSNDIEADVTYSAVGGGKHNQILDSSEYASVGAGLNNVINADYGSLVGGWKNKVYSNYGTVVGGFMNKVSSRFGTVLGGSKNTVAGRFSIAAGYNAVTTADYSAVFGFGGSTACTNADSKTVKFCTDSFVVNGFEVTDLAPASRRLDDEESDPLEQCSTRFSIVKERNHRLRKLLSTLNEL